MQCSISVDITLGGIAIEHVEVNIQDIIEKALMDSGNWMLDCGVMKDET